MSKSKNILALLNSVWPDECEIVGTATLRNIVDAVSEGIEPDAMIRQTSGGSSMDLSSLVEFLVQAATLVKVCLEIRENMPKQAQVEEIIDKTLSKEDFSPEVWKKLSIILIELDKADL